MKFIKFHKKSVSFINRFVDGHRNTIVSTTHTTYKSERKKSKHYLTIGILGLWRFSIIRYSKEHNVSETESFSVLRRYSVGSVMRLVLYGPNRILEYRAMDTVQIPSNPECYTLSPELFRIYQLFKYCIKSLIF
jgi:hypothetical protein